MPGYPKDYDDDDDEYDDYDNDNDGNYMSKKDLFCWTLSCLLEADEAMAR